MANETIPVLHRQPQEENPLSVIPINDGSVISRIGAEFVHEARSAIASHRPSRGQVVREKRRNPT